MTALFAGLTTLDVLHGLDHVPDPTLKTTSCNFALSAGGPATNAAVAYAALERIAAITQAHAPTPAVLLSAVGSGVLSQVCSQDLHTHGVTLLNASADNTLESEQAPAVSSIVDHPAGRMVASTNARVVTDTTKADLYLKKINTSDIDVIMSDGHNPELAHIALTLHEENVIPSSRPKNLTADLFQHNNPETYHGAPRILDGGSWKAWLPTLLSHIDIAVISADFIPPLCAGIDRDTPELEAGIVDFLRGFGIRRVVRTRGSRAVHWWWDDKRGKVQVPQVQATSTLGAGDIFHGAFAWAVSKAGHQCTHPTEIIEFASQVAALSTTYFGTRSWINAPELADITGNYLQTVGKAHI